MAKVLNLSVYDNYPINFCKFNYDRVINIKVIQYINSVGTQPRNIPTKLSSI